MTQDSLRSVTLATVANYRQVAERAVGAYRASGHRLLAVLSRSVDRAAARGANQMAPRMADAVRETNGKLTGAASKGIDNVSAQTKRVIKLGSTGVSTQVSRVADLVDRIENRYVATGLQAAARISLTGAQAALNLSEKLVAGANSLSTAIAGPVVPKVKRAVKSRSRGTAARAGAPARRTVQAQAKSLAARRKAVESKVRSAMPAAKAKATPKRKAAKPAA
jgi:hypothetical protein